MKIASLVVSLIMLLVAPILGAYGYRYADNDNNTVDPNLSVRINFANSKEEQEREIRELLIKRLKEENQTYGHGEISYVDDDCVDHTKKAKGSFWDRARAAIEEIAEIPWWGWIIAGGVVFAVVERL